MRDYMVQCFLDEGDVCYDTSKDYYMTYFNGLLSDVDESAASPSSANAPGAKTPGWWEGAAPRHAAVSLTHFVATAALLGALRAIVAQ